MRENKYDDPVFFEKYGQMDRSKLGRTLPFTFAELEDIWNAYGVFGKMDDE